MKMAKRDQELNTCLVQRFIIFHVGLLPGKISEGFDEAASVAEICEHILYYKEDGKDPPVDHGFRYVSEEAIKFAGLCRAFYSIQSTIDHLMNHDASNTTEESSRILTPTEEIVLSTCTLVFIPLEQSEIHGLVAVAQLPRRNQLQHSNSKSKKQKKNNKKSASHLHPEQIRSKVEKAHDLFKLMNGGGVHRRLNIADIIRDPTKENDANNDSIQNNAHAENFIYPGLAALYDNLKKIRKMEFQLNYSHDLTPDSATKLQSEISIAHGQNNELYTSLPIGALRLDLKQFYDSFLRDIGVSEC